MEPVWLSWVCVIVHIRFWSEVSTLTVKNQEPLLPLCLIITFDISCWYNFNYSNELINRTIKYWILCIETTENPASRPDCGRRGSSRRTETTWRKSYWKWLAGRWSSDNDRWFTRRRWRSPVEFLWKRICYLIVVTFKLFDLFVCWRPLFFFWIFEFHFCCNIVVL